MNNPVMVQICHGKIYPPYISAYALRANNLLKGYNTTIVSTGGMIIKDNIKDNVKEYRSILTTLYAIVKGNRYLEIALSRGQFVRGRYIESVKSIISKSDIVVLEGPWQYSLFKDSLKGKFIVYDAHNAESLLRKNNKYYEYTLNLEKDIVNSSDLILTVSPRDMDYFTKTFNAKNIYLATHILGNRVFQWNGENSRNIVFIGSIYGPNIEAVNFILSIARELSEFQFSIIGNVNLHRFPHVPGNVKFHGMIDEAEKNKILSSSFLALNPVFEGGGRNVKMVDYIMHGIPIITTEIGARGFSEYNIKDAFIIDGGKNYVSIIKQIASNREALKSMSRSVEELRSEMLEKEGDGDASGIIMGEYSKWKALKEKI
ncbi:MAG: glycosyltransferase [Ferroplasma sp.]|uniref:glycosyltransferase n=1 Tax=Ferroplasma sp. TaxID=2591003 RepID=UPI00281628ED|nr:glycosyltransferase [Ferroplasma sp.]WMT50875.1 MAG: glycosyltransferase [Ferroplasma sp.]